MEVSTILHVVSGPLLLLLAATYAAILLALKRGVRRVADLPLPTGDADAFVTVVVAARNEASVLPETLGALLDQEYPVHRFEVVVVDDRSTDATYSLLRSMAAADVRIVPIRVERTPPGWAGKMYALQQGVESARGDLILTTDADCLVPPGWVRSMSAALGDGNTPCFVAAPVDYEGADQWRWPRRILRTEFIALSLAGAGAVGLGRPLVASGQNLGYTRALFEAVSGYQHCAGYRTGDDIFMLFAARGVGARINYLLDHSVTVTTEPPLDAAGFYHQRARWASKGFRYPPDARLISLTVWLQSLSLVGGVIGLAAGCAWLLPWLAGAVAVKAVADLAFLHEGRRLGLRGAVTDYLTGLPLHPLYIIAAGLAGSLQLFRWKE